MKVTIKKTLELNAFSLTVVFTYVVKFTEIERENRILLEKMSRIFNKKTQKSSTAEGCYHVDDPTLKTTADTSQYNHNSSVITRKSNSVKKFLSNEP